MKTRQRTTRSTGSGPRRASDRKVVFVPREIELELVGIIGPGAGLPESDAFDSVFLDGDECLLALVESLRGAAVTMPSYGRCAPDALSPRDRPLH